MNELTSDDIVQLMREANRLRFERPHDAHPIRLPHQFNYIVRR